MRACSQLSTFGVARGFWLPLPMLESACLSPAPATFSDSVAQCTADVCAVTVTIEAATHLQHMVGSLPGKDAFGLQPS